MRTVYGEIPNENVSQYFDNLIGKTYKILPLFEEKSPTLSAYLKSYLCELVGNSYLFKPLKNEPKYITLLSTVEYLANEEYDHETCKREVLKCTHIVTDIRDRYFRG